MDPPIVRNTTRWGNPVNNSTSTGGTYSRVDFRAINQILGIISTTGESPALQPGAQNVPPALGMMSTPPDRGQISTGEAPVV